MSVETYISLQEASQLYNLDPQLLTRFVNDGRIRGGRFNGMFVLSEKDTQQVAKHQATKEQLRAKVIHLEGRPIGIREAAKKYDINHRGISRWAKQGYIRILSSGQGRGHKTMVDESDVAYAKEVARVRQARQGRQVFAPEYVPDWF